MMENKPRSPRPEKTLRTAIILFAVLFLQTVLLYLNYDDVVLEQGVKFVGTDPYYHVRLAWLTIQNFPWVPSFDYYPHYPEGMYIHWPPGFTLLLAIPARIIYGPSADIFEVGRFAATITPLFALFSPLALFFVARRWFGRNTALGASALLAGSMPYLAVSVAGRPDHHMLEPFFLIVVFGLWVEGSGGKERRYAQASGIAVALAVFFVPVAVIFPFLLAAFLFAELLGLVILKRPQEELDSLLVAGRNAFFPMFAGITLVAFTSPLFWQGAFDYASLSFFQPVVVLLLWLMLVFPAYAGGRKLAKRFPLILLSGTVLAVLAIALSPLLEPVTEAVRFLMRSNPKEQLTVETQPLLSRDWRYFVTNYSYLMFPFVPACLWLAFKVLRRRGRRGHGALLFLTAVTGLMVLQQVRFNALFIPFYMLTLAVGGRDLYVGLLERLGDLKMRRVFLSFAIVFTSLLLLTPSLEGLLNLQRRHASRTALSLAYIFDSLVWLREKTPEPGHYASPGQKPKYSVLAQWQLGHYIVFYGKRPVVSSPFGLSREELERYPEFMLADNEEEAYELCRTLGVRYIMAENMDKGTHRMYLNILDRQEGLASMEEAEGKKEITRELTEMVANSMGTRLYALEGRAFKAEDGSFSISPLSHFRLSYVSKHRSAGQEEEPALPSVKVFEVLRGATVKGSAAPGEKVTLSVKVNTGRNRLFLYRQETVADKDGSFSFITPYSNEMGLYGGAYLATDYEIESSGVLRNFKLTEKQVQKGEEVIINLVD